MIPTKVPVNPEIWSVRLLFQFCTNSMSIGQLAQSHQISASRKVCHWATRMEGNWLKQLVFVKLFCSQGSTDDMLFLYNQNRNQYRLLVSVWFECRTRYRYQFNKILERCSSISFLYIGIPISVSVWPYQSNPICGFIKSLAF